MYNENEEVEYMIRRLFKAPKHDISDPEECDYYSTAMVASQDTLKRRLNVIKRISESKLKEGRSCSVQSGCAR